MRPRDRRRIAAVFAIAAAACLPPAGTAVAKTIVAEVVALDQPIIYNRLGAWNPVGMVYALRQDVVVKAFDPAAQVVIDPGAGVGGFPPGNGVGGFPDGTPITRTTLTDAQLAGQVMLRPDKRPRPIILRMNAGDTLEVRFSNLLSPVRTRNDQTADRHAGFHPMGLSPADSIASDGTFVGRNADALAAPGEARTYRFVARDPGPGEAGNEGEGAFLVVSHTSVLGGEGLDQARATGLFGAVMVEPKGAGYFRSQVNEEDLRLATRGTTAGGHPVVDYNAVYPNAEPWISEGKAGLPILDMLHDPDGPGPQNPKLVHSDISAVIAYTNDGQLDLNATSGKFPPSTYPLERVGKRNPAYPNRLEPYREHSSIFHDETQGIQAFPTFFEDPILGFTLHGVKDGFMINYGSGGIGSEIIANRLGVGPMHDCLSCAAEEFFLTSFAVGDPGMVVDVPANAGLTRLTPGDAPPPGTTGRKANRALYPDDPSSVFHTYQGDFVKVRNIHAGPKEHHIFHLHNNQWLFNANDDNSNYLDAQAIGPGSGYTYELVFGGSGNRNVSVGDAIYHCHFYPHFAQGMWYHIRMHDVFEAGTRLEKSGAGFHSELFALGDGTPALDNTSDPAGPRVRALPDGEILVGTPIPALVPLPGKPMAPMPGRVNVVAKDADGDGSPESSQARIDRTDLEPDPKNPGQTRLKNPGYPFFLAGMEDIVGQRPPNPLLDMQEDPLDPANGGWDGGLPRHALGGTRESGAVDPATLLPLPPAFDSILTRLDFTKTVHRAKPFFYPQDGTDVEKAAMAYHEQKFHDTYLPSGAPATGAGGYRTNGAPPAPSAPYAEPCVDDDGNLIRAGVPARFFDGNGGKTLVGIPRFGASNPRVYKGAVIQFDLVMNKVGWHYPQQRILTLWDDAVPTIDRLRPPEPMILRQNALDCVKYLHTNLVPEVYELDDFQVRTPTDIIGQHIHLPKFEVISGDGSGNGWNYEDGTLSPGAVRERIAAINEYNARFDPAAALLAPEPHPFFGRFPQGTCADTDPATPGTQPGPWCGARTTIQRWFSDPLANANKVERGLGITFTHDHFGPSTHQQIGLYATMINEPQNSVWRHNETGRLLGNNQSVSEYDDPALAAAIGTRTDGGPTSWQAAIITGDLDADGLNDSYREFYFEFADFQQAYQAGTNVGGRDAAGNVILPDADSFRSAINPALKEETNADPRDPLIFGLNADLLRFPHLCPGFVPRPCPEAIAADDVGTFVVNYRNEPVGLRVFDPAALTNPDGTPTHDGNPGTQAAGMAGDLAFALSSNVARKIAALNVQPDGPGSPTHYGNRISRDQRPLDPYTPVMRAQTGDRVRVKIQVGATEEGHNVTIHGLKWTQEGSSFGLSPNSGWRNTQMGGISEQFTLNMPVTADLGQGPDTADHAYSVSAATEGWWNGTWGILRAYREEKADLFQLPNNPKPTVIANPAEFRGVCPVDAPVRSYDVTAVAGKDVLPLDPLVGMRTLVYNKRPTEVPVINPNPLPGNPPVPGIQEGSSGPLHDPTALLYVMTSDLEPVNPNLPACRLGGAANPNCPVVLKADAPIEPLVLRAAAGDCIRVTLRNRLTGILEMNSFEVVPPIVERLQVVDPFEGGMRVFGNNLMKASQHVGLHPQLVEYDVTKADGANVGINPTQTVPPRGAKLYEWYAGDVSAKRGGAIGSLNTARLVATPVEFGGVNLGPADKIKQMQKGMIGSLVVEPLGATWPANGEPGRDGRRTRASATITAGARSFRDHSLVWQSNFNLRFLNNTAVSAAPSEGVGLPEDSEDAGPRAFNYRSEPLWFRYGLTPNFHLSELRDFPDSHEAYSNTVAGGDPETPVFTASPGQEVRIRVGEPGGHQRNKVFNLHGHMWQRQPYVCPGSAQYGLPGLCAPGEVPSRAIGDNPVAFYRGGQEGIGASIHADVVLDKAGGPNAVPGDYLFLDQASFGSYNGAWGILRVEAAGAASSALQAAAPAAAETSRPAGPQTAVSAGSEGGAASAAASVVARQVVASAFAPSPATGSTLSASLPSPQPAGTSVTFDVSGLGGSGAYEYRFWLWTPADGWNLVRDYSPSSFWTWDTAGISPATCRVHVDVRAAGSLASREAYASGDYVIR